MTNMEGKGIPNVKLVDFDNSTPKPIETNDLFKGKVILFGVPGAFTPTCSVSHLPGFERQYQLFKKQGIAEVYCTAVNDAFVMHAWANSQNVKNVKLIPDGNGELAKAVNMLTDKSDIGFGPRSTRYSMLIENNTVKKIFQEPEGSSFGVSSAENMLKHLGGSPQEDIVVFTKDGCPYCTKAKEFLKERHMAFVEIKLNNDVERPTVVKALSGRGTVPQIFIDAKYIGGCDDLLKQYSHRT